MATAHSPQLHNGCHECHHECFPEVALKSYFFHPIQNTKHLVLTGAAQAFNTELVLKTKMVVALAFILVPDLGTMLLLWRNTCPKSFNLFSSDSRTATLVIQIWEDTEDNLICFHHPSGISSTEQSAKDHTNNHFEALHLHLQAELGTCHPAM